MKNYFLMNFRSIVIFSVLMLIKNHLLAQNTAYNFNFRVEAYQPLTGATIIDNGIFIEPITGGYFPFRKVPLGFEFLMDSTCFDSVFIFPKAAAIANPTHPDYFSSGFKGQSAIFAYGTEKTKDSLPNTVVRYFTEGVVPNRIFKVEFFELGFALRPGYFSSQIWLFENGDSIQIRVGEQVIPDGTVFQTGKGPYFGGVWAMLTHFDEYVADYLFMASGNVQNPVFSFIKNPESPASSYYLYPSLVTLAQEGSVFTFFPVNQFCATTSLIQHEPDTFEEIIVFPNPTRDGFQIRSLTSKPETYQFQLMNISGKTVQTGSFLSPEFFVDRDQLPPGLYILEIKGPNYFRLMSKIIFL